MWHGTAYTPKKGYKMPNQIQKRENNTLQSVKPSKRTPKNADLILADISSSMGIRCGESHTRHSLLQSALRPLAKTAHVLAFNSTVFEVDADNLPPPEHSTALHKAIQKAIELEPLHVLIISDGEPDARETSLDLGAILAEQCIIDCLFIGSRENDRAIEFMRELASIGRGRFMEIDISNPSQSPLLSSGVAQLLALPSPDGAIKL
jgi:hypothetical protein